MRSEFFALANANETQRERTFRLCARADSRPQARNPLLAEKSHYGRKTNYVVAPIWRDNMRQVG